MTNELDKKKQFRDAMWNYFGITEDNDLKWYEDIYESVVQPFCEQECNKARAELVDELGKMQEIQGVNGTWNYDPYMHGMYNGMEFCTALVKGVEPKYRKAPKKWLYEIKTDDIDGSGTQAELSNKENK